jgi:hypothetical protein
MTWNNKWGINRKTFRVLCQLHNVHTAPPHRVDSPETCHFGADYWHHYPVKDYSYQYNAWGLRGADYQQWAGQEVNICIGDSMTVNLGGPAEHSWCHLLGQRFPEPTLNYGIDGLCFYDFNMILAKAREYFRVKRIFVLYNLFDNDEETITNIVQPVVHNSKIDAKINILKQHCWVQGAHWQFDPPWSFFADELPCLYEHFPDAHSYMQDVKIDFRSLDPALLLKQNLLRTNYANMAGPGWISFEQFCQSVLLGQNVLDHFGAAVDRAMVTEYLQGYFIPTIRQALLTNRDGYHMSQQLNQVLADYFYQASSTGQ